MASSKLFSLLRNLLSLSLLALTMAGCYDPSAIQEAEPESPDMVTPRLSLPHTMRPVSAQQLVVDAQRGSGRTTGSMGLQTNRGNSIEYSMLAGSIPPLQLVVRDSGESVGGDGLNWIVNWATPKSNAVDPDPFLFVRIEFGEGGSRQFVELNAYPGFTMMIPGQSVDVYVGSTVAPGLDEVVTVNAQLHRSTTSSQTDDAHRSFLLPGAASTTTIIIPPFANDFGIYGQTDAAHAAAVGMFDAAAVLNLNYGINSATWDGPTLLAMAKAGERILIPGGATKITATSGNPLIPALLDFGIGL